MNIKDIKKRYNINNSDIASFFNLSYYSYSNSSAKKRYEKALELFYKKIKENEK